MSNSLTRSSEVVLSPHQRDVPRAFVAISQFTVRNGPNMTRKVKEAFRLHLVDRADGFLKLDVISPLDNPAEIWLVTYWRDQEAFETWHRSHHYKDAHKAIPKGLKLVRGSFKLRYFEHLTD